MKKTKTLVERLGQIRNQKKMSYDTVGEKAQLHPSLVEQIEKGMVSPSTGALKQISNALEIHLADLFQEVGFSDEEIEKIDQGSEIVLIEKSRRKSLDVKGSKAFYHYLTPMIADKNLELLHQEAEPKASGGNWLSHEGEECCYVVEGQFRVYVDDKSYDLNKGDTLWFKSYQKHKWENPGDKKAVVIWAITPPWF